MCSTRARRGPLASVRRGTVRGVGIIAPPVSVDVVRLRAPPSARRNPSTGHGPGSTAYAGRRRRRAPRSPSPRSRSEPRAPMPPRAAEPSTPGRPSVPLPRGSERLHETTAARPKRASLRNRRRSETRQRWSRSVPYFPPPGWLWATLSLFANRPAEARELHHFLAAGC